MIRNEQSKSLGMQFRQMSLAQAGLRLSGVVAGNPGPFDHLLVAQLCSTCETIDEVEREVRAAQHFSVDVDDALEAVRRYMAGHAPLSDAEAAQIDEQYNATHAVERPRGG